MTSGVHVNEAALEATDRLNRQLALLARQGWLPRCTEADMELWTSDWEAELLQAAALCISSGCAVIEACDQAAQLNDERWHAWGGRVYTRKPRAAKMGRPKKQAA